MTLLYFDTNVFVKLVVQEADSDRAVTLWDAADAIVSSRVTVPETSAALAASFRRGEIDQHRLDVALGEWSGYWQAVRPVELTEEIAALAGSCAQEYALSGADAVHMASALALRDDRVVMVSWDRRLNEAARAAGLRAVPAFS